MDLDEIKKQLEVEKLQHEVNLQKKPYKFFSNYAKVFTVIFQLITGAIALVFAYKNNWFDYQHEKLELQKMRLENDIKEFTQTKKNILDSIVTYRRVNDSMENVLNEDEKRNSFLKNENNTLQNKISKANENIDIIDSLTDVINPNNGPRDSLRWYIAGKVRDHKHNRISNANVTVDFSDQKVINGHFEVTTKSDSNGFFRLGTKNDLNNWHMNMIVTIRITKKGYRDLYLKAPGISSGGNYWHYYYLKKL